MTEYILKAHSYAEHELCCGCFSRNFPNIFRAAILKENFLMDFPYSILLDHHLDKTVLILHKL